MKRYGHLLIAVSLAVWSFSAAFPQVHPSVPKDNRNFRAIKPVRGLENDAREMGSQKYNPTVAVKPLWGDASTAVTTYDLQTHASEMNRIYQYPDGTIGAVCTWSASSTPGTTFPDRGTGYNYFNGSSWGAQPTSRIETSIRTGWPSYAPFDTAGEIILSHTGVANQPLVISIRTTKGTGTWITTQPAGLAPPSGASIIAWARMVTNGTPRTNIHVIALTEPVESGGSLYQGLNGALLYNRSTNGGSTWTGWQLLPGMTSSLYKGIDLDSYAWAEPMGDTLCFVAGDNWTDEFIMKSHNNGDNWTKTKIWTCPYDLWPGNTNTDSFYCSDGNSAVALDYNGRAHVAFGRQRACGNNTGTKFWFPITDGLIYWNENMAELPQSLDKDTIFVGWVQDTMVYYQAPDHLAYYFNSLSGMPAIITDKYNNIFVIFASVTTLVDTNNYLLRHVFARGSINDGMTWWDCIPDITANFVQYHWTECVYPSASPVSTNDSLYILFQGDGLAGDYVNGQGPGGQHSITNNDMFLIKPCKWDIIIFPAIDQKKEKPLITVYQNTPNPFSNQTLVNVTLAEKGNLSMEVYSMLGQNVFEHDKGIVNPGDYQFILNAARFTPGIYFYTVRCNNVSSTRKMIVE